MRHRTLFAGKTGLDNAKDLLVKYKNGEIKSMTPELWQAKKIVDSTLHPGTRAQHEKKTMRSSG